MTALLVVYTVIDSAHNQELIKTFFRGCGLGSGIQTNTGMKDIHLMLVGLISFAGRWCTASMITSWSKSNRWDCLVSLWYVAGAILTINYYFNWSLYNTQLMPIWSEVSNALSTSSEVVCSTIGSDLEPNTLNLISTCINYQVASYPGLPMYVRNREKRGQSGDQAFFEKHGKYWV